MTVGEVVVACRLFNLYSSLTRECPRFLCDACTVESGHSQILLLRGRAFLNIPMCSRDPHAHLHETRGRACTVV